MPDYRSRLATLQKSDGWFRIENKAGGSADVYIFDEIGFFGLTAKDFVNELRTLSARSINLHINSVGGEVFDGIAIRNAIRDHPAHVTTIIDGVAASSASFIALAGDEVVMNRNSEFMVHDPMGGAIGNAAEVASMVDRLNQMADNIAAMYAEKAGGTAEEWRTVMQAETWYTADEAVAAGLADRVADTNADAEVKNRLDFSIFNYAGRSKAPPPQPATPETPAASADGQSEQKEQDSMSDLMSTLRTKLGITDDSADEGTILAALDEALAEQTEPPVQNKVEASAPSDLKKLADSVGAVVVDRGVWEESQRRIQEGVDAARELRNQKRDVLLDSAVQDGRIPPASRQTWVEAYDRDPKGTATVIDSLRKNYVPVVEMGYALENENDLGEFADLFPKGR